MKIVKSNKGISLVELLVGLFILSLVMSVILKSFTLATKLNKDSYNIDIANTIAVYKVEELIADIIEKDLSDTYANNEPAREIRSYDKDFEEVTNGSPNVKYHLKTTVTRKEFQYSSNDLTQYRFMTDDHQHILVGKEALLVILHNKGGRREHKIYDYTIRQDYKKGILHTFILDEIQRRVVGDTSISLEGLNSEMSAILGSKPSDSYDSSNWYEVGKLRSGQVAKPNEIFIDNHQVFTDTIPINIYYDLDDMEDEIEPNEQYVLRVFNLLEEDIDLHVTFRNGNIQSQDKSPNRMLERIKIQPVALSDLLADSVDLGNVYSSYEVEGEELTKEEYEVTVVVKDVEEQRIIARHKTTKTIPYKE